MIELRDVSFSYDGRTILQNCSFTVPAGEHMALMGPSGQGKTTLLRLILGLAKPQNGSVRTEGRIACVFQEPRLLPWCTALENINAVLSDRRETLPLARHRLEQVELGDAADKYPAELSGGMQQRLAIARALAADSELLLLDEPLKGCDAALRDRLMALLQAESAGKTLLLVTHDPLEAQTLTRQTLLLDKGTVKIM